MCVPFCCLCRYFFVVSFPFFKKHLKRGDRTRFSQITLQYTIQIYRRLRPVQCFVRDSLQNKIPLNVNPTIDYMKTDAHFAIPLFVVMFIAWPKDR